MAYQPYLLESLDTEPIPATTMCPPPVSPFYTASPAHFDRLQRPAYTRIYCQTAQTSYSGQASLWLAPCNAGYFTVADCSAGSTKDLPALQADEHPHDIGQ